jgi:hypothetical protein
MASTMEVENEPFERCPECGSKFARDWKNRGFRRHLERLPKYPPAKGLCGGTRQSWGKGHRS